MIVTLGAKGQKTWQKLYYEGFVSIAKIHVEALTIVTLTMRKANRAKHPGQATKEEEQWCHNTIVPIKHKK